MCRAMVENGRFDPALCPLLMDLSPEQIIERLENDPDIRACALAVATPGIDADTAIGVCAQSLKRARAQRRAGGGSA